MHIMTLLPSQNLPQYKQFKGVNLSTAVDNSIGSSHWPPLPKISETTRFCCLDTLAATIVPNPIVISIVIRFLLNMFIVIPIEPLLLSILVIEPV